MSTLSSVSVRGLGRDRRFEFRFPKATDLEQDEEWCDLRHDGAWRRVRFHDYHEIYAEPGLYESLFYRALRCNSPSRVVGLLEEVIREQGIDPQTLRCLDVGAGNGMVGEQLRSLGASEVLGIDILEEACGAARRDRPWVYDDYFVVDLCDVPEPIDKQLREARLNCLATVAALGFSDIPPRAFIEALHLIESNGWLAFNIREDFVQERDGSGFAKLIRQLCRDGVLHMHAYRRYCHRLSITGEPLYYVAMVARKQCDLPDKYRE